MSTPIDLSRLPQPEVIEALDYETLLAQRKARLLELTPAEERDAVAAVLEMDSEPLVKLLQESAYRELLLRQLLNERAQALLVAYAKGSTLDHIGVSYYATERLMIDSGDPDAVPPIDPVYESDANYRQRMLMAPDSWSTAGPRDGYIYHAMSASGDVLDATAITTEPSRVMVTVLSAQGDGTADAGLLTAVEAAVTDDAVRPLTDLVSVQSATIVTYEIVASLEVGQGPDPAVVRNEAEAKITEFVAAHRRLGVGLVRDAALAELYVEGVQRVHLELEQDVACDETESAYCTNIEVTLHE